MVGMKYPKVAARSPAAIAAATSHQWPTGPLSCAATTRLAMVSRVSGTVVAIAQKRRPLSGVRKEAGKALRHSGTTTLDSYNPAPTAMPRLMTNSHSRIAVRVIAANELATPEFRLRRLEFDQIDALSN